VPYRIPLLQTTPFSRHLFACLPHPSPFLLLCSLEFPKNIAKLAGIGDTIRKDVTIKDANAIKSQFMDGNTTATETLALLEFLVEQTYHSSPNNAATPYGCEINGLAKLECPAVSVRTPRADGLPIRAVSLAGVFVPALWATNGKPLESLDVIESWYTPSDFEQMKTIGLNTVQITVPTAAFTPNDKYGAQVMDKLEYFLDAIEAAKLQAIITLQATGDELDAVVAAADYASEKPVVLAMTLPNGMMIDMTTVVESIRAVAPTIPLFVPVDEGILIELKKNGYASDPNVFGSLEISHLTSVADIASSTSQEDRSKLFYHEATACMTRSLLEYTACFQEIPIFLSSGFDLAIDDCMMKDFSPNFKDYGQCDRFDETVGSGWWARHRESYAARQLFAAERGLGWSFATWKLYDEDDDAGVIDSPAKLLSLKDVVAAGLFPNLKKEFPAKSACLNPPVNDFALGDETLAPTPAPPPDCGNGWWNSTTDKCK
jgi:hypothetical protein